MIVGDIPIIVILNSTPSINLILKLRIEHVFP